MYLYNLTLQKPTGICQAISGSFSAQKTSEIIVSKGNIIELYNIDSHR
jgi:splicing factor 3B subunit 3